MFVLVEVEDDVRIQPSDLSKKPEDAVTDVLQQAFVDKVIHDVGLVVTIYDILSIDGGYIYPNDGCAFFKVKFRLVVLRPFVGEVIVGRLLSCDKFGVKVSIGFFEDIYIPENHLQEPSFFDEATKEWFWSYEENKLAMELNEEIRFRVCAVKFNPEPTPAELKNAQGDDKLLGTAACPFRPMEIIADITDDGLGMTSWWQAAADGMDE